MTWLTDWNYRKSISISNSGSILTNYQVLVTIDTASLISSGKLLSSCADIRFTDTDGSTLLNYWIESGCNTVSTKIWIKIPSVPIGTKNIYIYYGNATPPSDGYGSSGLNTFQLFDEFESYAVDIINPNGWSNNVKIVTDAQSSNANSQGVKTTFAYGGIKSYNLYAYGYYRGYTYNDLKISVPTAEMLEGWIYTNNSGGSGSLDWHTTTGFLVVYKYSNGTFHSIYYQMRKVLSRTYYTSIYFYGPDSIWHIRDVEIVADAIGLNTWTKLTRNLRTDFEVQSGWGLWTDVIGLEIHLMSFGSGGGNDGNSGWTNAYFDDVRIRKYVSPEPTYTPGSEEVLSPANITATLMTITPSDTPCVAGTCTFTVDVTWTNLGGSSGTFVPNITIGGTAIYPPPIPSEPLSAGASVLHTFIVSGLTAGTHSICPYPN